MADDGTMDPADYGTQGSLNFQRLYAKGLLEQGLGPIPGAAVNPLQALGGMLNTVAGNQILERARQQEVGTLRDAAHRGLGHVGEGSGGTSQRPASIQDIG